MLEACKIQISQLGKPKTIEQLPASQYVGTKFVPSV